MPIKQNYFNEPGRLFSQRVLKPSIALNTTYGKGETILYKKRLKLAQSQRNKANSI